MSNAREARLMLRAHRYGALCTLSKKFDGHPFGSITPYLTDHDGSLLILISALAEHTKNIEHDPRTSLITHSQESPEIQAQGRVTVVGAAQSIAEPEQVRSRYLRYFPEAGRLLALPDFSFYRITPQAIRYIGGFGKIHWIAAQNYAVPSHPLIEQEGGLVAQINAEQRDTLASCCRQLKQVEASEVMMVGIDCDGFDLRAGERLLRFDFSEQVRDAEQARQLLLQLAQNG